MPTARLNNPMIESGSFSLLVARFKMRPRFLVLVGLLLGVPGVVTVADSPPAKFRARSDLAGIIRNSAGQPITNATISIYAAWPKADGGVVANRSSDDLGKHSVADADGKFAIKALDSSAFFQILFVAKGYRTAFFGRVDTAVKALEVTLKPAPVGSLPNEQVRGRVIDSDGKPVAGALVEVYGAHREKEGWRQPPWDDIESPVFSDAAGEFSIRGDSPFVACDFTIEADGFAKSARQQEVSTGRTIHEIRLSKGAWIQGRLLKEGQPMADAGIGISGVNVDVSNRNFSARTDNDGRFSFTNIPPGRDYYLFGIMQSLKDRGALPVRRVEVNGDGSIVNVGDLNIEPAFELEGVVRFSNGKPAPPNCTITLCRTMMEPRPATPGARDFPWQEDNLDSWEIRGIGKEARFRFSGVPAEAISIFIMAPPFFHLSQRNGSGDPARFRLLGRVITNKTDLVFEIEPGELRENSAPVNYQNLSQKPLHGAELAHSPANAKR